MFHWLIFGTAVAILLILDLTVFHKHSHEPSLRESAFWTCFWSALALCFNGFVWWWLGAQPAIEFLTGYLVEWSLSMDNVFVFAVVFSCFLLFTMLFCSERSILEQKDTRRPSPRRNKCSFLAYFISCVFAFVFRCFCLFALFIANVVFSSRKTHKKALPQREQVFLPRFVLLVLFVDLLFFFSFCLQ